MYVLSIINGPHTCTLFPYTTLFRSFSFDVNFKDGNAHQFAFYAVDWDSTARAETIQILDANTSARSDTHTIELLSPMKYVFCHISGQAKINVTRTAGNNAVVSGVFF